MDDIILPHMLLMVTKETSKQFPGDTCRQLSGFRHNMQIICPIKWDILKFNNRQVVQNLV